MKKQPSFKTTFLKAIATQQGIKGCNPLCLTFCLGVECATLVWNIFGSRVVHLVPSSLDETGRGDSISQIMTGFCLTGRVKIHKLSKTSVQLFVFHRLSRTFKAAFPKLLKTLGRLLKNVTQLSNENSSQLDHEERQQQN